MTGAEPDLDGVTDYPKDLSASIGADPFVVAHAYCPAFPQFVGPDRLELWDALRGDDGWNYGAQIIGASGVWSPSQDPGVRACLIYRNPLDQAVSHYLQTIHLKDYGRDGDPTYADATAFFYDYRSAEKYLKLFLTFWWMRDRFPRNVRLIAYERFVRDPRGAFGLLLGFMRNGRRPSLAPMMQVFDSRHPGLGSDAKPFNLWLARLLGTDSGFRNQAIEMTSPENMKARERDLGHALTGPHVDERHSHINDGRPGAWKQAFGKRELSYLRALFSRFDVPMSAFIWE